MLRTAQSNVNQKYHFFAPKVEVTVNQENIEKYGFTAAPLTVEEATGATPKCSFAVVLGLNQLVTALFELHKPIQVKMGYQNALETIFTGEITLTKNTFPSNGPPQLEVHCEANTTTPTATNSNTAVCTLDYCKTMLSFTATLSDEKSNILTPKTPTQIDSQKQLARSIHCTGECVGLPEIKVGAVVAVTGVGSRFSQNYLVEKAVHSWDSARGYTTGFEGKSQSQTLLIKPKIYIGNKPA